jgi:hypothetical protein
MGERKRGSGGKNGEKPSMRSHSPAPTVVRVASCFFRAELTMMD